MKYNLYIALFHGRNRPDEYMEDWGLDGPIIGPVGVAWTYDNLRLLDDSGAEEDLPLLRGMVAYDGKFYGDFTIMAEGDWSINRAVKEDGVIIHDFATFQRNVVAASVPDDSPPFDPTQASNEGWGLFNECEIQRIDEDATFGSDREALKFVKQRASDGSLYHQQALALLKPKVTQ